MFPIVKKINLFISTASLDIDEINKFHKTYDKAILFVLGNRV